MSGYSGFEIPPLREVPRRYAEGVAYLVRVQLGWWRRPRSVQAHLSGFELMRVCAQVRADLAAGRLHSRKPILAGGGTRVARQR